MNWRGLLLLLLCLSRSALAQETYWQLDIKGPIGSGSADFIVTELTQAQATTDAPAFILLTLDTPGGLYDATRGIISAMLASSIPVVVYVTPSGARAASAGTYILYASHVAAMAPGTHLGAATPVLIGASGRQHRALAPTDNAPEQSNTADDNAGSDALTRKTQNDAIAYIRTLAQLRGRNAEWAELAVRDAATLTAPEALAQKVIELMVPDIPALLLALDGRQVSINDTLSVLATAHLSAEHRLPNWRQRFIIMISNPNITYLLLMIGVYGLLLEFMSPGIGLAGISGAICLLLAIMALQLLPFNLIALALLLLGLGLMVAEAITPSLGLLGLGGVVAFVIGSVLLFDTPDNAFQLAWPLIGAFALVSLGFMLVVIRLVLKQRRRPLVSGVQTMVGAQGLALTEIAPTGYVLVQGERWQAHSVEPIAAQQTIEVMAVQDLTLSVRLAAHPPVNHLNEESP